MTQSNLPFSDKVELFASVAKLGLHVLGENIFPRMAHKATDVPRSFEHITTEEAAHYVRDTDRHTAATVTAHHLLYNRNALFTGGIRPHYYCLPVLKREKHRLALVAAATRGNPKFFLGTDSAPHPAHLKEHASGCAGCYTAHAAIEMYAEAFDSVGALDKLEAFASFHGADFYGLPRNQVQITLRRESWTPPESFAFGQAQLKPLRSGEALPWRMV